MGKRVNFPVELLKLCMFDGCVVWIGIGFLLTVFSF